MKKLILALFVIIGLGVNAQTDVYFNINHLLGVNPFAFNEKAMNDNNEEFKVTRLQYYISEIKLTHDGGTETMVPSLWILVDASSPVNQLLGNFNITSLESVTFGIGVDRGSNHLDPASFPLQHPLSPKSPSMHWGWSSGYRFLALEGKAGTNLNLVFEIHALGDGNYAYVNLTTTGTTTGSGININIDADYEKLLNGISVSSGPTSHSETGISKTALENSTSKVFTIAASSPNGIKNAPVSSVVSLYPNPSNGIMNLTIDASITGMVEVVVMDVRGQVVSRKQVNGSSDSFIEIENNGLYLVNILVDGISISQEKVLISK